MDDVRKVDVAAGDPRFLLTGGKVPLHVPPMGYVQLWPDGCIANYALGWYFNTLAQINILDRFTMLHGRWHTYLYGSHSLQLFIHRMWGMSNG